MFSYQGPVLRRSAWKLETPTGSTFEFMASQAHWTIDKPPPTVAILEPLQGHSPVDDLHSQGQTVIGINGRPLRDFDHILPRHIPSEVTKSEYSWLIPAWRSSDPRIDWTDILDRLPRAVEPGLQETSKKNGLKAADTRWREKNHMLSWQTWNSAPAASIAKDLSTALKDLTPEQMLYNTSWDLHPTNKGLIQRPGNAEPGVWYPVPYLHPTSASLSQQLQQAQGTGYSPRVHVALMSRPQPNQPAQVPAGLPTNAVNTPAPTMTITQQNGSVNAPTHHTQQAPIAAGINISNANSSSSNTTNGLQSVAQGGAATQLQASANAQMQQTQQIPTAAGLSSGGSNASGGTIPGLVNQDATGNGAPSRKRKASDDIAHPATRPRFDETRTMTGTAQQAILQAQAARARMNAANRVRQAEQARQFQDPAALQAAHIDFFDEETGEVLDVVEEFLPPGGVRPPRRMISIAAFEALTGESLVNTAATTAENEASTAPTRAPGYSLTSRPDLNVHRQPAGPVQRGFNPSDDFQTSMRLADANAGTGQIVLDDSEDEDILDDNNLDDGPFPWPASYYARESRGFGS